MEAAFLSMTTQRRDVPRIGAELAAELRVVEGVLERHFGWGADPTRRDCLLDMLLERVAAAGERSIAGYVERLSKDEREVLALGERLTVSETFFFRTEQHFKALAAMLPDLRKRSVEDGKEGRLRILSAACASGEEPYSMAMLLAEQVPGPEVEIEAVDLDCRALEKAVEGSYTEWSLRALTPERRERFFVRSGKRWELAEEIRERVQFRAGNLLELAMEAAGESFDVIFCRNVFIYFTQEAMRRVIDDLTLLLRPGGYLFLGPSETLRGVSANFHLCHTHETFYYQRKQAVRLPSATEPLLRMTALADAEMGALDLSWFDAINRSSERVRGMGLDGEASRRLRNGAGRGRAGKGLSGKNGTEADSLAKPWEERPGTKCQAPQTEPTEMADVLRLMAEERFAEALVIVEGLHADTNGIERRAGQSADRRWVEMLRAALLTNLGRTEEAMRACTLLLGVDEMSAPAYYLRSLCLERKGKVDEAVSAAETAAYLDSKLAMAQFHLGVLARRAGDTGRARMWFKSAKESLQNEDSLSLLLFGGGFSREGLQAVCEGELEKLGVRG